MVVVRESVFMVTIDTKQKEKYGPEVFQKFIRWFSSLLKAIFNKSRNNLEKLLIWKKGNIADFRGFRGNIVLEIGGESEKSRDTLHAHVIIRIQHTGKVQLNLPYIRNYLQKYWKKSGFKEDTPFVRIKGGDSIESLKNYTEKQKKIRVIPL